MATTSEDIVQKEKKNAIPKHSEKKKKKRMEKFHRKEQNSLQKAIPNIVHVELTVLTTMTPLQLGPLVNHLM